MSGATIGQRRLRMGLIGGGGRGFIGRVHAIAATMDGRAELVAAALSSDPQRAQEAAARFVIPPQRAYGSYRELLDGEQHRPAQSRIDFVTIATPNATHFEIARAALEAGLHVVCEKPLTTSLADALALAELARRSGRVLAVMYNYSGYPMVRQARHMIRQGELGEIQAVRVHYLQGWLRTLPPGAVPPRGAWKADPAIAGPSGTLADIGTHAYQLVRFITELEPVELASRLRTFSPHRPLDDYGHVLLQMANGALAMITVSQVSHGHWNDLSIEVDGTRASLAWQQEQPNQLVVRQHGGPTRVYERNPMADYSDALTRASCRLPAGHPEGFLEAFANVYRAALAAMGGDSTESEGEQPELPYPDVRDGVEGVWLIEQCLASHQAGGQWIAVQLPRV